MNHQFKNSSDQSQISCLFNQYLLTPCNNQVQARLLSAPDKICFSVDCPQVTQISQLGGSYVVALTQDCQQVVYMVDGGFKQQLSKKSPGENLILYKNCAFFNSSNVLCQYVLAIDKSIDAVKVYYVKYNSLVQKTEAELQKENSIRKITLQVKQAVEQATVKQEEKKDEEKSDSTYLQDLNEKPKKEEDQEEPKETEESDYIQGESQVSSGSDEQDDEDENQEVQQIDVQSITEKIIEQLQGSMPSVSQNAAAQQQKYINASSFFITKDDETVNEFSSAQGKLETIRHARRQILCMNSYGEVSQQRTQNYVLQISPNNSDYQGQTLPQISPAIDADIKQDCYAFVNQYQLQVQHFNSKDQIWKATFSRMSTPIRVCLCSYDYAAVFFDNGQFIVYSRGEVIMHRQVSGFLNFCGMYETLVLFTRRQIVVYDCFSIKQAYQTSVDLDAVGYCELLPQGLCLLETTAGLQMLNFLSPMDGDNLELEFVHSFVEEELVRVQAAQERILDVLRDPEGKTLTRGDIQQLRAVYRYPLYSLVQDENEPFALTVFCVEVPQDEARFSSALRPLLQLTISGKGVKNIAEIERLFASDVEALRSAFPGARTPQIPLLSPPELVPLAPSPPVNAGADDVDRAERALVLAQAMLNGYLTFAGIEGEEGQAQNGVGTFHSRYFYERQFDAVLARFAGACMGEGLRQRALSAVRLTRTREVLGLLAQMAT